MKSDNGVGYLAAVTAWGTAGALKQLHVSRPQSSISEQRAETGVKRIQERDAAANWGCCANTCMCRSSPHSLEKLLFSLDEFSVT